MMKLRLIEKMNLRKFNIEENKKNYIEILYTMMKRI